MGHLGFLVSSVVVLVAMMISENQAESHHELCLEKKVNFTHIEYVALGECVKEYAPAPTLADGVTESPEAIKERIKKAKEHKCMEACFMNHKKMFNDGVLDMEQSEKFIEEFPEEAREELKKSLKKCAEDHKIIGKKLTMDNDCHEYEAFIKCVDDDENKICKREE